MAVKSGVLVNNVRMSYLPSNVKITYSIEINENKANPVIIVCNIHMEASGW
jgi:hypothetical protein